MKGIKKHIRRAACFSLAMLTVFATACDGQPVDSSTTSEEHTVWSQDALSMTLQDEKVDVETKTAPTYEVSGGRGEYESAQIIISAGGSDISSYTIEASDLVLTTDNTQKITADNIGIYNEKYIEITTSSSSSAYGVFGWYPDALLPFDVAVEYGENKVKAGENQGIYISTYIPRTTPAGVYTGVFTLTVDGEKYEIPATATVWDFEVSQQRHFRTIYAAGGNIGFAELDRTNEIQYPYLTALADMGMSKGGLNGGFETKDEWVEWIRVHTNPNLVGENGEPLLDDKELYLGGIPVTVATNSTTYIDHDTFDANMSELFVASVKDNFDYISLCYSFLWFIDEPIYNNTWTQVELSCQAFEEYKAYWAELIRNTCSEDETIAQEAMDYVNEKADASLTKEDFERVGAQFIGEVAHSMLVYAGYVTAQPDSRLNSDYTTTLCPPIGGVATAENRYALETWTDKDKATDIYYVSGGSYGYVLDDDRLHQRLHAWYAYSKDLGGYLVWDSTLYVAREGMDSDAPTNAYENARRVVNANGDGFLFYPGAPYGIYGPVPSMRLLQQRDSLEEYEYLYYLGQMYANAGYDESAILEKIFSALFNEANINADTATFAKQRELLVNLILLAQRGVFVTDYTEINGLATLRAAAVGEEKIVSVNGETCNQDVATIVYDFTAKTGEFGFTTQSGLSFTLANENKSTSLLAFETDGLKVLDGANKTGTGATAKYSEKEGTAEKTTIPNTQLQALKFTYHVDNAEIDQNFANYNFTFDVDSKAVSRKSDYLTASFYNPSEKPLLVKCYFVGSGGVTLVKDMILQQGTNVMYVTQLDAVRWNLIKSLNGIRFTFHSYDESDVHEFTVYCTGVSTVM